MNMKIKQVLATVSCAALSITLVGCSSNQKDLSENVKKYLGLDAEGEQSIATLFEEFDKAWDTLTESTPVDEKEMMEYSNAIGDAYEAFTDEFHERYEVDVKAWEGEQREEASQVLTDYAAISLAALDLTHNRFSNFLNKASEEVCFETAVNFVNVCSRFFYGENRIGDEDLDRLVS